MARGSVVELTADEIVERLGISVTEAARRCGLGYQTMHALITGTARRVGLDTLARVCDGLECELGDVLRRVGPPIQP